MNPPVPITTGLAFLLALLSLSGVLVGAEIGWRYLSEIGNLPLWARFVLAFHLAHLGGFVFPVGILYGVLHLPVVLPTGPEDEGES